MDSLMELLEEELRDIYDAEHQLLKALPKLARKASCPSLKEAFTNHLRETEGQVKRLEEVGKALDITLKGKTCQVMKGLVKEGQEAIDDDGESAVVDANLIGAAQRVEHYEMAAYGTVRALAERLGHTDAARLLQDTLTEEGAADKKLTAIAEGDVLPAAPDAGAGKSDVNGVPAKRGNVRARS